MKNLLTLALFVAWIQASMAQEVVQLTYVDKDNVSKPFEAVVTKPSGSDKKRAVVILHHKGGWKANTTNQYAEFFAKNNILSVEPRMFAATAENPMNHLSQVFSSLKYLASRNDVDPNQISIMGLSYGASLSLYAATQWASEKYAPNVRIKNILPLYPTCFFHEELIKRSPRFVDRMTNFGFPEKFHESWTHTPITIFSAGLDDYESRTPQPCQGLIQSMSDAAQKNITQEITFPKATHGWDIGANYSNIEPLGCKMTKCSVTVTYDAETTQAVKNKLAEIILK
jgi:dienelactone hydrolase